jgi:hypothetical protein
MPDTTGLKTIRLNLARNPDFPDGSVRHGYRFTAPLDKDGRLDPAGWKKHRDLCRVVRIWGEEEKDIGHLVHRPGGGWGFTYDLEGDENDESGFKLGGHVFAPGQYVSITDDRGKLHTFVVMSVENV